MSAIHKFVLLVIILERLKATEVATAFCLHIERKPKVRNRATDQATIIAGGRYVVSPLTNKKICPAAVMLSLPFYNSSLLVPW